MTYISIKTEPRLIRERDRNPLTSTALVALLVIAGCIISIGPRSAVEAGREFVVCSFYGNNAQSVYESNPIKYKSLDGDKDGQACE